MFKLVFLSPRITGMTATLNNHKEVASFLRCTMEHAGGARPVVLREHVKIGDTVREHFYFLFQELEIWNVTSLCVIPQIWLTDLENFTFWPYYCPKIRILKNL